MSHARRRRTLRSTVLAVSLAVLTSFAIASPALADPAATSAPAPSGAPGTSSPTGTTPAPTETTVPTQDPAPDSTTDPAPVAVPDPVEETPAPLVPTASEVPVDAPVTDSAADVGTGDTVVGELVQAFADPAGHVGRDDHGPAEHEDAPLSWIQTPDGASVQIATEGVPPVAPGSTLAVTVGEEQQVAAADVAEDGAREVLAATVLDATDTTPTVAPAGTGTTNLVTAVLVVPAGGSPDATTVGQVVDMLTGAVSTFWDEQSNGAVRIGAVAGAAGWVSSSASCTASGFDALMADVARQIGWSSGPGEHLMLYIPHFSSMCGGAYGMGQVKAGPSAGGSSWVGGVALDVMAHELGHNFGLGHSAAQQCDSSVESGTCRTVPYGDYYDVMGISWGTVGTLNTAQAARLGFLPAGEQVPLTSSSASTTVTLVPVAATAGTRAVRLTASNGAVYYLEYRRASGRDAWLSTANSYGLDSGLVLRRAGSGSNTSVLLDGTPSPSTNWGSDVQQSLPAGRTVTIAGGAFSITAGTGTAGGIAVSITTPVPPVLTGADAAFGRSLYADMMGRPADDGGLAGWVSALGRTGDRRAVSRGFSDSLEYRMLTITQAYQQVLSRTPDQGGMTTWLDALATGRVRLDSLRLALMASQEFYLRGGGGDSAFVNNIYQAALGRAADASEVAYWSDVRRSSGASTVITAVWGSPEAAMRRVDQAYTYYLGRSAGRSEQEYWLPVVMGAGDERLREEVVVSYEYYLRSGGRFR